MPIGESPEQSCEIQVSIVCQTCIPRDNGYRCTGSMSFETAFSPLLPFRKVKEEVGRVIGISNLHDYHHHPVPVITTSVKTKRSNARCVAVTKKPA